MAGAYYQPTTVTYQTLPTNYLPMTTSAVTYQDAVQNNALLMNRSMPFTFTADEKDAKDEKADKEKTKEVPAK